VGAPAPSALCELPLHVVNLDAAALVDAQAQPQMEAERVVSVWPLGLVVQVERLGNRLPTSLQM
jgi:hypothetical protein